MKSQDSNKPTEARLEAFLITCIKCNQEKRLYETNIFINWLKKYYIITCFTCGTVEAFDEQGQKINFEDEKGS